MNKVNARSQNASVAKFLFASKVMFKELKIIKYLLYLLNVVPVVIVFLPSSDVLIKTICSLVSFSLTLVAEISSQLVADYKEKAILEHQIYEAEITGSTFSKIEYDRESTNDVHERAIRKGMPLYDRKPNKYQPPYCPDEISDDYTYLFIARQSAAKNRFLLSRDFYFYIFILAMIAMIFITFTSIDTNLTFGFYYIICLWPLIVPIIRNAVACQKCMRQCVKISADIDNFFADGDDSIERLARFYYYVQNIEFEMLLVKPMLFTFIEKLNSRPLRILQSGVTVRFKDAITELKSKKYIKTPKGKSLITKLDYDLEKLIEKEKRDRVKKKQEVVMKKELETVDLPKKSETSSLKKTPSKTSKKAKENKKAPTKKKTKK